MNEKRRAPQSNWWSIRIGAASPVAPPEEPSEAPGDAAAATSCWPRDGGRDDDERGPGREGGRSSRRRSSSVCGGAWPVAVAELAAWPSQRLAGSTAAPVWVGAGGQPGGGGAGGRGEERASAG